MRTLLRVDAPPFVSAQLRALLLQPPAAFTPAPNPLCALIQPLGPHLVRQATNPIPVAINPPHMPSAPLPAHTHTHTHTGSLYALVPPTPRYLHALSDHRLCFPLSCPLPRYPSSQAACAFSFCPIAYPPPASLLPPGSGEAGGSVYHTAPPTPHTHTHAQQPLCLVHVPQRPPW